MDAQTIINASYSEWKTECEPVIQQTAKDDINRLFQQCADSLDGDVYAEFAAYAVGVEKYCVQCLVEFGDHSIGCIVQIVPIGSDDCVSCETFEPIRN
jgi:hypothetical protein